MRSADQSLANGSGTRVAELIQMSCALFVKLKEELSAYRPANEGQEEGGVQH